MMDNQNTNGTAPETQQEKTFTQEQVNAIVSKRLAEAKASNESALNKREEELNQREMRIRAKELLSERGQIGRASCRERVSAENEQNEQATGKYKYEGFRPIEKGAFHEYDAKDPFREAMGLK